MEKINTVKRDNPRIISLSSYQSMKYIRPKHDKQYYFYLLCLSFLCVVIFWTISYLDEINMINNGFVSKNAVTFEVEEVSGVKEAFTEMKDSFILFQYDPNLPELKHVFMNGNVELPPLTMDENKEITKYNRDIAITGNYVRFEVPNGYQEIGHFNTPNSYKLNTEMWLISHKPDITIDKGHYFTIMAPNRKELNILKEVFQQDTINFLNTEMQGTYALSSNRFLNSALFVSVAFLVFIFILTSILWISKEKNYVNTLYLSGTPLQVIFKHTCQYKILPYTILSAGLISICIIIQKFVFPLWTDRWIFNALYLLIGLNIYLSMLSFIKVFSYTVKKGGKRF